MLLANEGAPEELISEIEASLQRVEESVMDEISREAYRTAIHSALKHLIITGNVLLYLPEDGGIRVFHLDRFVIDRDPMGNVIHIATKENMSLRQLLATTSKIRLQLTVVDQKTRCICIQLLVAMVMNILYIKTLMA